jgi:hypothetical protein
VRLGKVRLASIRWTCRISSKRALTIFMRPNVGVQRTPKAVRCNDWLDAILAKPCHEVQLVKCLS